MEENTNCDLGMLYEDSKNQMTGQGVSDQTFFFKKTKQNKTEHHHPHHSLLVCSFGVFLKKKKLQPERWHKHHSFK